MQGPAVYCPQSIAGSGFKWCRYLRSGGVNAWMEIQTNNIFTTCAVIQFLFRAVVYVKAFGVA